MPPDLVAHVALEGAALVFAAGGLWYMLREMRSTLKEHGRMLARDEARYRKLLVMLAMIAGALPANPGRAEQIQEQLNAMMNEGAGADE